VNGDEMASYIYHSMMTSQHQVRSMLISTIDCQALLKTKYCPPVAAVTCTQKQRKSIRPFEILEVVVLHTRTYMSCQVHTFELHGYAFFAAVYDYEL